VIRVGRIVGSIDAALASGTLDEPFSNEDFRQACPGFGKGTYNAFLWKHSVGNLGNQGGQTELFVKVGVNSFKRLRTTTTRES